MPIYHTQPYSTPSIDEGYRPGMVHAGTYDTEMTYNHPQPVDPYMSPAVNHPTLSQDVQSRHNQQDYTPQHIQPTPYTFPHLPIPLPEYERPTIPRSASNPNNSLRLSNSTTTPSDGSISQTTTTVNVSLKEGEYYPSTMKVCYPDDESPSGTGTGIGTGSGSGSGSGQRAAAGTKIDKLSERLGEFFLGPEKNDNKSEEGEDKEGRHVKKSRKSGSGDGNGEMSYGMQESDGLTESARNAL
jgi:hypothetical protein